MLGTDQNPIVVFNRFSYAQLQANLRGLDAYLECISGDGTGDFPSSSDRTESCDSIKPTIDEIEEQGVSSIAVLSR